DDGTGTPAIEVDAESVAGPARDLRALLWRSVAVDYSLMGDAAAGMEAFQRALAAEPSPLAESGIRMYLGLLLGKRMGRLEDAVAELGRGLALVQGDEGEWGAKAAGWVRLVMAHVISERC